MNTQVNDGGPAFPIPCPDMTIAGQTEKETQGMSLRDWFAGQALAGSIACVVPLIGSKKMTAMEYAESLLSMADAMIAAKNTQPNKPHSNSG